MVETSISNLTEADIGRKGQCTLLVEAGIGRKGIVYTFGGNKLCPRSLILFLSDIENILYTLPY